MSERLAIAQRRKALRLGLINAALWSMGYALTSGAIISYLAIDLGATGRALSLLLAAPSLAGVLRLFAPTIIAWSGSSKRTTLGAFSIAYLVLLGLPLVGLIAPKVPHSQALTILVFVVCSYQLLDFIGVVALWTWFADLVPLRIRGNYFGWRQLVQLAVTIPAAMASGYFSDHWRTVYKNQPSMTLLGYAIPNGCGAFCMLISLVPLVLIPAAGAAPQFSSVPWREMWAPFRNWQFRRLLSFRAWMSFANGISQTAERTFPKNILKLGLGDLALMKNVMQVGQMGVARWAGPFSDRFGNRAVLVASQWFVSLAMLFYLVASPASRWQAWLILGAWILWSFYAGHNICLPNLALKLAPAADKSPYVAAHEALAAICHAGATIAGGFLFDWLSGSETISRLRIAQFNPYTAIFFMALAARMLAVPVAAMLVEPGAWTWRQIAGRASPKLNIRDAQQGAK
jgi:MFS family permease